MRRKPVSLGLGIASCNRGSRSVRRIKTSHVHLRTFRVRSRQKLQLSCDEVACARRIPVVRFCIRRLFSSAIRVLINVDRRVLSVSLFRSYITFEFFA